VRGPVPLVKDVMAREPAVAHVDLALAEAAARMRDAMVGALFAVDGDELVGVVTDRDIVVRCVAEGRTPSAAAIIDVMTRHVVFCHQNSSLEEAGWLMARQKIRRLAVVDDDRELAGAVSLADLARGFGPDSSALAAVLRAICQPTATAKTPAREDRAAEDIADRPPACCTSMRGDPASAAVSHLPHDDGEALEPQRNRPGGIVYSRRPF
jgi:CBS domain-containing protein